MRVKSAAGPGCCGNGAFRSGYLADPRAREGINKSDGRPPLPVDCWNLERFLGRIGACPAASLCAEDPEFERLVYQIDHRDC